MGDVSEGEAWKSCCPCFCSVVSRGGTVVGENDAGEYSGGKSVDLGIEGVDAAE